MASNLLSSSSLWRKRRISDLQETIAVIITKATGDIQGDKLLNNVQNTKFDGIRDNPKILSYLVEKGIIVRNRTIFNYINISKY